MKPPTKKPSPPDVPADNPVGTMERFTAGLKRVLSKPKPKMTTQRTAAHSPTVASGKANQTR